MISIQKENLKSKPTKFRLEKGLYFWVNLVQAVMSKTLDSFTKYYSVYKILVPITTSRDKRRGNNAPPPPPSPSFSFVKYPRPLRVK